MAEIYAANVAELLKEDIMPTSETEALLLIREAIKIARRFLPRLADIYYPCIYDREVRITKKNLSYAALATEVLEAMSPSSETEASLLMREVTKAVKKHYPLLVDIYSPCLRNRSATFNDLDEIIHNVEIGNFNRSYPSYYEEQPEDPAQFGTEEEIAEMKKRWEEEANARERKENIEPYTLEELIEEFGFLPAEAPKPPPKKRTYKRKTEKYDISDLFRDLGLEPPKGVKKRAEKKSSLCTESKNTRRPLNPYQAFSCTITPTIRNSFIDHGLSGKDLAKETRAEVSRQWKIFKEDGGEYIRNIYPHLWE